MGGVIKRRLLGAAGSYRRSADKHLFWLRRNEDYDAAAALRKTSAHKVMAKKWKPIDVFCTRNPNAAFPLVILNQPLDTYADDVLRLWTKASLRATTDGGTNQFHQLIRSRKLNYDDYLPDLITGDFDSIDANLLEFYKNKGCTVIHTPDQDYTDFTKALQIVLQAASKKNLKIDHVVAVVNMSGRFDHIMANIQTLYHVQEWTSIPVYIVSAGAMTWLLGAGSHEIAVDESLDQTACGLIPVGEPCNHVTTTGLKWNLTDQRLQFGSLISTSNTYDGSKTVTIQTDKPLVWTMEMKYACLSEASAPSTAS